ncbi:MAG: GNAT family acetyltransferase [Cyclobacteriaceae bacterium]
MTSRKAFESDIDGMVNLQKKNLFSELNEEERKRGFVTTPFTLEQIEEAIRNNGLFVSEDNNKIVAYAFAGSWNYFEQWPIFPYMTSRFPDLNFKDFDISVQNTFQYGPVCIDINYRGKGLLNSIFEEMRIEWVKKFPLSITFINAVNEISARAHKKIGWEIIDRFEFSGNKYLGLAFDMNNSVI